MNEKRKKARWVTGVAFAGLLLVGAGCSSSTMTNVDVNAPAEDRGSEEMEEKKEARQLLLEIGAQNSSGISGEALLIEQGAETLVLVTLDGATEGDRHPAHIHVGACPTPGTVKFGLSDVVDGKSETTLDASFDSIVASGELAINVHQSAEAMGVYYACGDLEVSAVTSVKVEDESMMKRMPEVKARVEVELAQ